jgi:hypothetical protein
MRTLWSLLALPGAAAAAPLLVPHQGRLLDANGAPITGVHELDISIYASPTAPSPLWTETQNPNLDDGFFAIVLGSVTPLPATLFDSNARYVEVAVDNGAPMGRTALLSVPYAIQATSVAGGSVRLIDDTTGCAPGTAGSLRWHGGAVQVCDGSGWTGALGGAPGTANNPGTSCKDILDRGGSHGSDVYWVKPTGRSPMQVRCDMDTDSGGWTLVFSSQVVHAWADHVTTNTAFLDTLAPTGSRASVYAWPDPVTQMAWECRNRLTNARHFYTNSYSATAWSNLSACTQYNCSHPNANGSSTTTLTDLAANVTVTSAAAWRWNLGAEGETHQYNDFSLDPNWGEFTPQDSTWGVAWGTGDGGNLGSRTNVCSGVRLFNAGSQPNFNGTPPANPESYTSDAYFYVWIR